MHSYALRPALLLVMTLGLPACPSDDTGDEGADTIVATTQSAETDPGTTTPGEGNTTQAAEGTTQAADDTTTGGELVLADIEVTVSYAGPETGTLNVVAITEFPPMGPPVAIASDMAPVFPWTGTLNDLEAGEYIIFATLDVGGNNPTIPGPEDPQSDTAMPVTVVVDGPGPFQADVTLVDPM